MLFGSLAASNFDLILRSVAQRRVSKDGPRMQAAPQRCVAHGSRRAALRPRPHHEGVILGGRRKAGYAIDTGLTATAALAGRSARSGPRAAAASRRAG